MSLIDMIVGIAIMLMVFTALFNAFTTISELSARNRLRANALMLANEHLEIIRALPYDSIGTVSGLPPGNIPQNDTVTHDRVTYNRRTFIQYVDDPADGLGAADPLSADYKRVKVELSYTYRGVPQTFSLTTSIAPKSQESLAGAGVLRINVTDAANNPIPSASVHIVNTLVATSVDITTFTNASGTVSFPGAWAGSGYQITVTKPGYSTAQTYAVSPSNPNPSPSAATVAENSTTEIYFKIDVLSPLELYTRAWPVRDRFLDDFTDATQLSTTSDTQVTGGALTLTDTLGIYHAVGTGTSNTIAPPSLGRWLMITADTAVPAQTTVTYHVLYDTGGGVFAQVPESDLPGNAVGFNTTPIDVGTLSVTTYPSLRIQAVLTTTNTAVTPQVREWKLSYLETDTPIASVPFTLTGSKTIGTDAGGNPVYKYSVTDQTNGSGRWNNAATEWDEYTLSIPGYTLAETCPSLPLIVDPDTPHNQLLTLATPSAHTLQVHIEDTLGARIPYAEVRLVGGTTDLVRTTGPCGVSFFSNLSETAYTVSVEVPHFTATTTSVTVSGATPLTIVLTP
jgi:Carboxypeptidase regulatory-like domain